MTDRIDGFEDYQYPYSEAEIYQYLERIGFPKDVSVPSFSADVLRDEVGSTGGWKFDIQGGRNLDILRTLQACHLCTVPFESLALHYAKHPQISIDARDVYEKLVTRRRGGYCMEQNTLLYHILKALGFSVYCAGARSRTRVAGQPTGPFPGW